MKTASIIINAVMFLTTFIIVVSFFRKDGAWQIQRGLKAFRYFTVLSKEIPHNAHRGPLACEFQPLAACKNLDYPPGNLRFLQFAID